jgi:hypothetical protein
MVNLHPRVNERSLGVSIWTIGVFLGYFLTIWFVLVSARVVKMVPIDNTRIVAITIAFTFASVSLFHEGSMISAVLSVFCFVNGVLFFDMLVRKLNSTVSRLSLREILKGRVQNQPNFIFAFAAYLIISGVFWVPTFTIFAITSFPADLNELEAIMVIITSPLVLSIIETIAP